MRGPIRNRFRVHHEKLPEEAVVVEYQLVNDVGIAQVRCPIHAWEKPGGYEGQEVNDCDQRKDQ